MEVFLTRSGKIGCILIFIIYCLKVIGLAPFSVYNKKSTQKSGNICAVEFSKIGLGYNVMISILLPSIAAFSFYELSTMDYINRSSLTRAADMMQGYLIAGASFTVLITWTLKQRKAINIIDRLFDINDRLGCMEIQPSYKKSLILLSMHVTMNILLWTSLIAVTKFLYTVNVLPEWIIATLPGIVISCYIIEYSMILGLITAELESVNQNLLNINKIENCTSPDPLLDIHPHAFSPSSNGQRNVLLSLQSLRTALFETSKDISNFFSFPMLACLACSFLVIVFNFYYIIIPVVLPNKTISISSVSVGIIWLVIGIYPIVSLLCNTTKTVDEAKLTGHIVHKLLASSVNKEIKSELQRFSLQLLHEEFTFTAYGFFSLDFTLLHTMMGATATYITICIQFQ